MGIANFIYKAYSQPWILSAKWLHTSLFLTFKVLTFLIFTINFSKEQTTKSKPLWCVSTASVGGLRFNSQKDNGWVITEKKLVQKFFCLNFKKASMKNYSEKESASRSNNPVLFIVKVVGNLSWNIKKIQLPRLVLVWEFKEWTAMGKFKFSSNTPECPCSKWFVLSVTH